MNEHYKNCITMQQEDGLSFFLSYHTAFKSLRFPVRLKELLTMRDILAALLTTVLLVAPILPSGALRLSCQHSGIPL